MARPRKYDPEHDLPVTLFVKIPVHILKKAESIGISRNELGKELEKNKIVENYLINFLEKCSKKG